jgi:ABC-type Na+ efflux pump permease subunit
MKMSKNENLIPVDKTNRLNGFKNLLLVELNEWWSGKSWIWTTLLWLGVANGMTYLVLAADPTATVTTALTIFFLFLGLFPPIETILVMQDSLVEERISGTVSWILSKPVSRQSFIFAKWLGNSIFLLITIVAIPGIVGYFEISLLSGVILNPLNYTFGLLILTLYHLFFIECTLLLGTFKEKAGAVAAPPMIFNFAQQFLQMIPFVGYFLPLSLVFNQMGGNPVIIGIILREELFSLLPVISIAFLVVSFLFLAVWQFEKQEL